MKKPEDNPNAQLDDIDPPKPMVTLGGVEREFKYTAWAFKLIQRKYGSWAKAWAQLRENHDGEIDIEVLTYLAFVGLGPKSELTLEQVEAFVDDMTLMDLGVLRDKVAEAVVANLPQAKKDEGSGTEGNPPE